MDNAQRFLSAFVKIEKQLKVMSNTVGYVKFYHMLDEAGRKNGIIKTYSVDLQEYADLRNAIVHQRTDGGEVIAQPNIEVVEKIEMIANLICTPPLLEKYFLKTVKIFYQEDSLLDIMEYLDQNEHSKVPIYNASGFHCLLSSDAILKWAIPYLTKGTFDIKESAMEVTNRFNNKENCLFLDRGQNVQKVMDIFEASLRKGDNLAAILISEHGIKSEKPIGIITHEDLPKIVELLQGKTS